MVDLCIDQPLIVSYHHHDNQRIGGPLSVNTFLSSSIFHYVYGRHSNQKGRSLNLPDRSLNRSIDLQSTKSARIQGVATFSQYDCKMNEHPPDPRSGRIIQQAQQRDEQQGRSLNLPTQYIQTKGVERTIDPKRRSGAYNPMRLYNSIQSLTRRSHQQYNSIHNLPQTQGVSLRRSHKSRLVTLRASKSCRDILYKQIKSLLGKAWSIRASLVKLRATNKQAGW